MTAGPGPAAPDFRPGDAGPGGRRGPVRREQRNTSGLPGGDPTRHAELVASANAWKALNYDGMNAATLYATLLEEEAARAHQGYWH